MERITLKWDGKQSGVYCIRNKINNKVYIGSSKDCYHRVRGQHYAKLQAGSHSNPHLQSAWNKYGKESFESFCLELCRQDCLFEREQFWIKESKCLDNRYGYNKNPSADRIEHTDEQKLKISLSNLGKKRRQLPTGVWKVKNKYGDSWTVTLVFRHNDYYLGNFVTLETATDVHDRTLDALKKGSPPDWEWIDKLRTKLKSKKAVLQLTKDGDVVNRFGSARDVGQGFDISGIRRCCRGKQTMYKGFKWAYESEDRDAG